MKKYLALSLVELMLAVALSMMLSLTIIRIYFSLVSYQELIRRIQVTEHWVEGIKESIIKMMESPNMEVNSNFIQSRQRPEGDGLTSSGTGPNVNFVVGIGSVSTGFYQQMLARQLGDTPVGYPHVLFNKNQTNDYQCSLRYCTVVRFTDGGNNLQVFFRAESPSQYNLKDRIFGYSLQTNQYWAIGAGRAMHRAMHRVRLSPVLQGAPMLEFMFRVRNPDGTIYYGRNQADMAGAWDRVEAMHIHIHAFVPRPGQGVFSDTDPYHREVQLVIPTR